MTRLEKLEQKVRELHGQKKSNMMKSARNLKVTTSTCSGFSLDKHLSVL